MGYLNKSKIVAVFAYLLIIGGAIMLLWSFQPVSETKTIEIPADGGIFYRVTVSGWMSGHVSGSYTTDVGSVNVYVMDKAQYDVYWYELNGDDTMYAHSGTEGTFSLDLPSTSTYYICVDHGMSDSIAQTVTLKIKITGIEMMWLALGAVVLIIGVLLAVVGMRMKAKERAAMPPAPAPESQPTDVTMFDTKRRP